MKKVFDIGAFSFESLSSLKNLFDGDFVTVFEPHPLRFQELKKFESVFHNLTVLDYAISDKIGTLELVDAGPSSFARGLSSPAVCNDGKDGSEKGFVVNCSTLDVFDADGDIDILYMDTEGSEYFALQKMISRPELIQIEMEWRNYKNPYFSEIQKWMRSNKYCFAGIIESDHIYVRD